MDHKTFTGTSKRVRNVNLSGRGNPWANLPSSSASSTSQTLANAQAEREKRQQERDRLNRAKIIQRLARGRADRQKIRAEWRVQWDSNEAASWSSPPTDGLLQNGRGVHTNGHDRDDFSRRRPNALRAYDSREELISQLRLLLAFAQAFLPADRARIAYFGNRLHKTTSGGALDLRQGEARLLKVLGILCIQAVASIENLADERRTTIELLSLLGFLPKLIPTEMAAISESYFLLISNLISSERRLDIELRSLVIEDILAILSPLTASTLTVYMAFATKLLPNPELETRLGNENFMRIFRTINYKLLASCLATAVADWNTVPVLEASDQRLWLLARFIRAHNEILQDGKTVVTHDMDFIRVVSSLLGSLAHEVSTRINVENGIHAANDTPSRQLAKPLAPFVKTQIESLVQQNSVSSLLAQAMSADTQGGSNQDAQALATYALTLLRVFPAKADDIRSWLMLSSSTTGPKNASRTSPIRFFWQSAKRTNIFARISKDQKQVLTLLKPPSSTTARGADSDQWNKEWQIILLFFELYTFILKFMDDEEFLKGGEYTPPSDLRQSWTKEGALPLEDVKSLTIFLKNLGFTLYWNASDLADDDTRAKADETTIRNYFATNTQSTPPRRMEGKKEPQNIAGMLGLAQKYLKELVTGLLRMIHQRDSRRRFLPKDHWLMTSHVDISGFIPAVVAEEERRTMMGEEEDEDEDGPGDDFLDSSDLNQSSRHFLIGTSRAQQNRRIEAVRRNQEKANKKRVLEAVAPRLEILRNLPFFIPFDTRVQIFREFVHNDQVRRRQGFIDPDTWRMSVMHSQGVTGDGRPLAQDILSRHHADIRRNAVFQSAFEQFYPLGDGLKEPIQISFIDQFGTTEAGIDGGGVTKEFLTSVTNEAFNPTGDLDLFVENEQHLLYPNPGAIEERKELLRQASFLEGSPEWREELSNLLRQYEFLGRVIGKCMYEGILVDVNFAGFFLLKWASTGHANSSSSETSYKPNLNDLRDLDEGLYQGLLQLKNYPGNVEDFSLTFTITDTITLPTSDPSKPRPTRSIDHDLIPNGSTIPVTNTNRLQYLNLVVLHRLRTQQHYQTRSFLQGLSQIISSSWLSMFNQSELQTLVSGDTSTEIDIEDLRSNTQYGGLYVIGDDGQEHPVIRMFWDVMRSLPNETRKKVLKFVTSTPRPPLGGFSHLNPRFSIRDSGAGVGEEGEDRLPSTSTCVNLLKLPRYRTKERLRDKLVYSVESGAGFDLS